MQYKLDLNPKSKDENNIYASEPWLIDKTLLDFDICPEFDENEDNIRMFVPLDLNKESILRRLDKLIYHYGEVREYNEYEFSTDVDLLVAQIEIYDQVWCKRHNLDQGMHSSEALELVKAFVSRLEEIPDACAERFPFETIDELKEDYL